LDGATPMIVTLHTATGPIVLATADDGPGPDGNGIRRILMELEGWDAPGVRNTVTDRQGAHGADQGPWWASSRPVTVHAAHQVQACADPDPLRDAENRRLVAAVMPLGDVDDAAVTIEAFGLQAAGWVDTRPKIDRLSARTSEWQLVIHCADYRRYSTVEKTLTIAQAGAVVPGLHWATLHWSPLHWGTASSTLQGVAHSDGEAPSAPVIRITGPVTNPMITNGLTGVTLRFVIALAASETLVIDCDAGTAEIDGSSRLYTLDPTSSLVGDFQIVPGDNPIGLSGDILDAAATAVLTWRDATL
jgi:hypothetical protein